MTEPDLRAAVLNAFRDISQSDTETVFAAAKGLMEQRVLSDPVDVQPALRCLDALLAYFRLRPT